MRYMPTLRSPVSGSLVTTQGRVMKRPPSIGQHFWIGKFRIVSAGIPPSPPGEGESFADAGAFAGETLGAIGHAAVRVGGASNLWMISLHGPVPTILGRACRNSNAWPSNFNASFIEVGGLA